MKLLKSKDKFCNLLILSIILMGFALIAFKCTFEKINYNESTIINNSIYVIFVLILNIVPIIISIVTGIKEKNMKIIFLMPTNYIGIIAEIIYLGLFLFCIGGGLNFGESFGTLINILG